jgi:drug/metabolite transporter (DMT)-like permease
VDPLALGFVALAAVLHAAWNILLKTSGDRLRTAAVGMSIGSVFLVPAAMAAWLVLGRPDVPPAAWAIGGASGVVEVAYFACLAEAYRRSDLSVVYPIARGSAPLFALAVGVVVLGERLPPAAWGGVGLLIAGLLVVQRPWRFLGSGDGRGDRAGAGLALLTGATIAGYSSLDRVGVQLAPVWAYAAIIWPATAVGLLGTVWLRDRRGSRPAGDPDVPFTGRGAIAGGALMLATYGLVLGALARAPLVIVAPLRESAVVLASAWGIVRLGEAAERREVAFRIAGALLVLAGAAVLAVAR